MNFPNPEQASLIRKTKDILQKDLNSLLEIFGPYEKKLDGWFVSGGCIASLLRGEKPNDYDIYFSNKETMDHVVSLITQSPDLLQHVEDVDQKYRDLMGKDGKCITENAITMKNGLQFITKHYGNIRKTFDFVHCMPVYKFSDRRLHISEEQYECCTKKILKVNEQISVTDVRIAKFEALGYVVSERDTVVQNDLTMKVDYLEQLFGVKKNP
jgi:hypothetical protein